MRFFALLAALAVFSGCATADRKTHDRAMLHLQIGTGYLTNGQYPLAMQELLTAEQMDPNDPLILNNLGLAYYVRGKFKEAETKFRAAVRAEPKFSDAKNNLGRVLIETNRMQDAIKVLHEIEGDLTYNSPEKTLSNLGMAYFKLGQYKRAEDYLSRSLEIRRQSCTTADFYGRTLLEMKRLVQSAQVLDQAIEYCRAEKFEEPIYFSAMSYFTLGERAKARARIEELLKDYPKSR
jgi:type IV pilus assembly protein PilF